MSTVKNGFHISNLHSKKYVFKKTFFKCQFTRKIPKYVLRRRIKPSFSLLALVSCS